MEWNSIPATASMQAKDIERSAEYSNYQSVTPIRQAPNAPRPRRFERLGQALSRSPVRIRDRPDARHGSSGLVQPRFARSHRTVEDTAQSAGLLPDRQGRRRPAVP